MIGKSLRIWGSNFVTFQLVALAAFLPLLAYSLWVSSARPDLRLSRGHQILTGLGGNVLGMVVSAFVIYGVFKRLHGERPSLGKGLGHGLQRLLPVIGVTIISGLMIVAVMLLAMIPTMLLVAVAGALGGLKEELAVVLTLLVTAGVTGYVMAGLWVAVPVAVVERPQVSRSLSRSWFLTQGFRMRILVPLVGLFMLEFGLELGALLLIADPGHAELVTLLGSSVLVSLQAVLAAVGYHELRVAVEGAGVKQLAAVFD